MTKKDLPFHWPWRRWVRFVGFYYSHPGRKDVDPESGLREYGFVGDWDRFVKFTLSDRFPCGRFLGYVVKGLDYKFLSALRGPAGRSNSGRR